MAIHAGGSLILELPLSSNLAPAELQPSSTELPLSSNLELPLSSRWASAELRLGFR